MPRDEATVDRIFAGNLDDLPPLSSKVPKKPKVFYFHIVIKSIV